MIAHELGHGAFALEHTFETYGVPQGDANNLMDYADSEHLTCWQWDLLHNPRPVWSFLEGDESGMATVLTIEFTPTSNFVQMVNAEQHKKFINDYTSAYQSYQANYEKESERLINRYLNIKINGKIYKTNSVATIFGRDHGSAYIGRFHNVFEINDLLEVIIAHSSYIFYDLYIGQPLEICVLNESVGFNKMLDYKWELYRILKDFGLNENDLIAIDGVVYNANEIGNYIWALALSYHGVIPDPNWIAETGTGGRNDEPWEQRAIKKGEEKVNNLSMDEDLSLQYRLEYFHLLYNDTDKSWREIDPFKDLNNGKN